MALEGHRGLELVRGVVRREGLEDGLVEAARRLRAVGLEAVLHANHPIRRVFDEAAQECLCTPTSECRPRVILTRTREALGGNFEISSKSSVRSSKRLFFSIA